MNKLIAVLIGILFAASAFGVPALGTNSGKIDFGKVPRGAIVTYIHPEFGYSMFVLNAGDDPIKIKAVANGDVAPYVVSIDPSTAIVPAHSQVFLKVSVSLPRDMPVGTKLSGSIYVSSEAADAPTGGGAALQLALQKDITVEAGEKVTEAPKVTESGPDKTVLLVAGVLAIAAIAVLIYIKRGRA